jgi:SAM-dependent methyltransferase
MSGQRPSATIWHDVECGDYTADLALWEQLAEEVTGPVLDLGCGTGRVALYLGRRGHGVTGLDLDPELIAAFGERGAGLPVTAVVADARGFELESDAALALAPMQLMQLLSGPAERVQCLRCIAAHLPAGGRVAMAIVERMPEAEGAPPPPDVREIDGWVYSSLPLDATVDGGEIVIRRLRQTLSPAGDLSEEQNEVRIQTLSARQLESEGVEAGLVALRCRSIPPTDLHVGSSVVLLEVAA